MQVKKSQILLTVGATKKTADAVVSISVPFSGMADSCLKSLKSNCPCAHGLMKGSEESALAYALFEVVRDKLSGSGLEVFKTKANNVSCSSIDGHFNITFHTQSTGTSLRKTCGIVLGCLNTGKLFTKYSENIKFLSGKGGKKEEFNSVSKKFIEGVKKSIVIISIGKYPAGLDKEKLTEIVVALSGKLPEFDIPSAKELEAPPKHEDVPNPYPIIKSKGVVAAITADYIRNNSNGMSVGVEDSGVVIYNHGWETKHKQLKEDKRIEDYINKKYAKLEDKDELSILFAYHALSEGFINAEAADKLLVTELKTSKLISLLKSVL